MFRSGLNYLRIIVTLLAIFALPVQPVFAAGQEPPAQAPCVINNYTLPSVSVGGANSNTKFIEIIFTVDERCRMVETSRRALDNVPADVVQSKLQFNQSVTAPSTTSSLSPESVSIAATTNTAHVKIYQLDCCGITTISLQTDHAWTWTSTTAALSGNGSTNASWCCYWWHLTAGPTMSHGVTSSSQVYARGSASYVCYSSNPSPFCQGTTRRYPMTFYTWLKMYNNGVANANGTSYSGTVIPYGKVVYQFWKT